MSGAEFDTEFLYILPASVMNDFTRFMDSLSRSDWILFGKNYVFKFSFPLGWCCIRLFKSELEPKRMLISKLANWLSHRIGDVRTKAFVHYVKCLFLTAMI